MSDFQRSSLYFSEVDLGHIQKSILSSEMYFVNNVPDENKSDLVNAINRLTRAIENQNSMRLLKELSELKRILI